MARAVRGKWGAEDLNRLAAAISSKGVLLSLGDTRLPEDPLIDSGMEIVARTGIAETVWIKP